MTDWLVGYRIVTYRNIEAVTRTKYFHFCKGAGAIPNKEGVVPTSVSLWLFKHFVCSMNNLQLNS